MKEEEEENEEGFDVLTVTCEGRRVATRAHHLKISPVMWWYRQRSEKRGSAYGSECFS